MSLFAERPHSLLGSLLIVLITASASAATIGGRVVDATGRVLAGVTVEITASRAKAVVAVTDGAGTWRAEVPPGIYDVRFRLLNFTTVVKRALQVDDDHPVSVPVNLTVEASASIVVTGKKTFRNLADLDEPVNDMIGVADAASAGIITAKQIEARPTQRAGDVLESVPGVVISQHSGEGKANQYYLRGFNLDHGTDLAATVAGAPVNMPTHAHGQGYSDENFLIPELISGVQYEKGPHYAEEGDFSSAGAININYANALEHPMVSLTGGQLGYQRALAAGSRPLGSGQILAAIELSHNDGPWRRPDDYRKANLLLRYTGGGERSAYSVTLSGYDGLWNSSDQIPHRAISHGLSRFGEIDPSDGGRSSRYAAVGDWQRSGDDTLTKATVYAIGYRLNLFSDFTYFLDDPVNGDQFEQEDRRFVIGGRSARRWFATLFGRPAENLVGTGVRHDRIGALGLYHTRRRERLEAIRADRVFQTSGDVYAQTSIAWTEKFRTVTGMRFDAFHFDVRAGDRANGGTAHASLVSPKLSMIFGPWHNTEGYASAGLGFHSNDGRGATLTRDPKSGQPADRVNPLSRTRGAEIGFRTMAIPRLQSTLALWGLDIASELVFAGDAGTTEPSRPSRRTGVEWSNYFRVADRVVLDADLAWSRARFRDRQPAGDRIPGSVAGVVSAGMSVYDCGPFSGSIRYRYLGQRPLIEDNSVRSRASHTMSADLGAALSPRVRLVLEGLNLTNARVSDIDYFYTSRLPGEPLSGVSDIHTHPVEPRTFRLRIEMSF